MKKLLAMLLAIVMALSIVSVMAFAEGEQPKIIVDGVKDAAYTDKKSIGSDWWEFYLDDGQTVCEPVDYERVKNTLWFDWDDESVYIYFQCESKDDLYKPAADETEIPSYDFGPFYEIAQIYLDTAPSIDYYAACSWADEFCDHMACNCREGAPGSKYRLMARANPAWGQWNDFYATASGMFMSYEQFADSYAGREGYEDMAAKYAETHGNGEGQAASFIDYETNTYGFEMKFPRAADEEYFQVNVRTRVNETEWEEFGPELAYSLSLCPAWWMNSKDLVRIYYSDYENDIIDPAVAAIQRKIAELPSPEMLGKEHKDAVNAILSEVEALTEEQAEQLTEEDMAWLLGAAVKMELFAFVENLGDLNGDSNKNANDALMVLKASVNKLKLTEDQLLRADVTGDEVVNAKDALEILQYSVKKRTEFSVERMLEF